MPVLDGDFEAFVTNLGKYNEGELVGEWVKFPTTEEELKKVFERIGIGTADEFGQPYEEWFITDYECPISEAHKLLGEYESLDKLNYLASLLDNMSSWEQDQFVAIMDSGCDQVNDLDDMINLAFNIDKYDVIPDISDHYDLGYYYVHDAGIYSEKELGPLANYIDYERFGRDIAMDEQGRFTDFGYVRDNGDRWNVEFSGEIDDIPDEYRVTGSSQEQAKISVLVVEPEKEPYIKEIDPGLESLQHEVGGYIQAVYPYEEPVAIVCNEEGKLEGLPLNRALRDEDGDIYDIVAGTFMVVGLTEDSFGSLSDQLAEQFMDKFKTPEQFVHVGEKIVAIPMETAPEREPDRTLTIYQLKDSPETAKMQFMNMDYLKSFNMTVDISKYDEVYSGSMKPGETLEGVYERFNLHHPADFRGHSLSVSDVVAIHENGRDTAFYVDSYGFKEIPDFFKQLEVQVSMDTDGLAVAGHIGTWHTIDHQEVEGATFYLMEHDTYGDDAACIIVDSHGKLSLSEVYNGFDEHTVELLRQEVMPVDRLPDETITVEEMKDYGYAWGGMLPLREDAAAEVMKSCTVYRLYGDDTEGMVMDASDLKAHAAQGGIFGVEKVEWIAALERENPLKAAEMSMEDDYGMIDGIINNGPKEEPKPEKGEKASIMDRLKASKSEPPKEKALAKKERKGDLEL